MTKKENDRDISDSSAVFTAALLKQASRFHPEDGKFSELARHYAKKIKDGIWIWQAGKIS